MLSSSETLVLENSDFVAQDAERQTESTEHASVLQLWLCVAPPDTAHDAPPFADAVLIVYDCDCVPPPHVVEQDPHEPHAPAQSTGHAAVLQLWL